MFKSIPNNGSKSVLQNKGGNLVKTIPEIACPNLRTCLQKRLPKSLPKSVPKFVPKFAPKFKHVILVAKIIYRVLGRVLGRDLGKDLGRRFWRHLPKFGRTFFRIRMNFFGLLLIMFRAFKNCLRRRPSCFFRGTKENKHQRFGEHLPSAGRPP